MTLSPGGRAKARGARDSDPLRVSWAASNGKNRGRIKNRGRRKNRKNEEAKMQERENQGEEQQEQSQPQQSSGPLGVPSTSFADADLD